MYDELINTDRQVDLYEAIEFCLMDADESLVRVLAKEEKSTVRTATFDEALVGAGDIRMTIPHHDIIYHLLASRQPRSGKELDLLLDSILVGIPRHAIVPSDDSKRTFLSLGYHIFRQAVGEETIMTTTKRKVEDEVLEAAYLRAGGTLEDVTTVKSKCFRTIQVNLYPNELVAEKALRRHYTRVLPNLLPANDYWQHLVPCNDFNPGVASPEAPAVQDDKGLLKKIAAYFRGE